tara:strand:- start:1082 stop:1792 length:711 start_codon:yes stop_codon:yes gene_type:complete
MTVETTHNEQEFDGNDSAVVFPFNFPFFNDSEIFVYLTDVNGIQTELNQLSDYTITAPSKRSGGQINYPVTGDPLATGEKLLVVRTLPVDQTASIRNQGRFNAAIHETVFDKITMILQQFFGQAIFRFGGNNKMGQDLNMGSFSITDLDMKETVNAKDAINRSYADSNFANIDGDTMTQPLAGPNSIKSDDYMPQAQITETIDERMSSAPEFDPNNFQDYGLVTAAVTDQADYGSI